MSDELAISCRLCLRADERGSMAPIDVLRKPGEPPVLVYICHPCATYAASWVEMQFLEAKPEVVFNGPISAESLRDAINSSVSDSADRPLVLPIESDNAGVGVDRPEPQVSAGRAKRENRGR